MNDLESARARAEALNEPGTRALRSARRAQLWAGLNRYLASESAHARKVAVAEKAEVAEKSEKSEKSEKTEKTEKPDEGEEGLETRDSG